MPINTKEINQVIIPENKPYSCPTANPINIGIPNITNPFSHSTFFKKFIKKQKIPDNAGNIMTNYLSHLGLELAPIREISQGCCGVFEPILYHHSMIKTIKL